MEIERNEKTTESLRTQKELCTRLTITHGKKHQELRNPHCHYNNESGSDRQHVYICRPHKNHLTTRFGLLFYNDRIVITEAMRTSIVAMLHRKHPATDKMKMLQMTSGGPKCIERYRKNWKAVRAAELQVRTSKHKYLRRR